MLLSHPSYSMFVSSAEERKEASHENWAPNYHHPPSDVDVAGTALHVYVAATVFIHTHTNLTDGYNYQWASCSPNLKVSKNRLCSLSPFPATTPNFWTTWRSLSPSGDGDWQTNTHTPLWAPIHVLHLNKTGTRQIITASKGKRAYLALQSLIQEEKNLIGFSCLLLELRQTRVDLTLKTSVLTCTTYSAVISNAPLASAKASL